ncbi:MAG: hypothetical protein JNM88_05065 [Chitinophagaceae bacterium]|nr:hypothetical protein [Chitinophagaceae bacterium]
MKENTPVSMKRLLAKLFLFFAVALLLTTSSCNNDDSGGGDAEIKVNCVKLTKDQVQKWVSAGWTNPADSNRIKDIVLQFYFDGNMGEDAKLKLVGYPGQSADQVIVAGKTVLDADTSCQATVISGETIFSDNMISLKALDILDEQGQLKDFDYIRFTPERYPADRTYINYKVEVVIKGVPKAVEGDGTWPCPPHCPDPE